MSFKPIRHTWPKIAGVKLRLSLRHIHNLLNTKRHEIRHARDLDHSSVFPSQAQFSFHHSPFGFLLPAVHIHTSSFGCFTSSSLSFITGLPLGSWSCFTKNPETRECPGSGREWHLVRLPRRIDNNMSFLLQGFPGPN